VSLAACGAVPTESGSFPSQVINVESCGYTPAPLVTSTPFTFTNTGVPGLTTADWTFNSTAASGCASGSNDLIFQITNTAGSTFNFQCNNGFSTTATAALTGGINVKAVLATNIQDSALASATAAVLCGGTTINFSQCTVNQTVHAYQTTLTSASGCTALTQCGTIAFTFPTAYAASPFCSAPGIQDTSTPADLWVGDIDAISTTAITYSYATLISIVGTKNLTVTFTCGSV
jgi:hypothetical protein